MPELSKVTTQMRKGILEYIILWIINKWEIYWAEIIKELKKGELIVVEWTLYPLLSRLKKDWLIDYYWVESDSGHPRKYYRLTEEWKNAYIIMANVWENIENTVNKLIK